nr:MAG TPA: hypothetical protein [Caudoviricetes sp.]
MMISKSVSGKLPVLVSLVTTVSLARLACLILPDPA